MHELPITKSILKSVLAKAEECGATRVVRVVVEVGELREFVPVIVQKYWDYAAEGALCEGARVELVMIPATAMCGACGRVYDVDIQDLQNSNCPRCGCESGKLCTGRELRIRGMEIA